LAGDSLTMPHLHRLEYDKWITQSSSFAMSLSTEKKLFFYNISK